MLDKELVEGLVTLGRVATARTAHREFICTQCGEHIEKGKDYFSITIGGGGLGSLKFPDRVHLSCLETYAVAQKLRKDGLGYHDE